MDKFLAVIFVSQVILLLILFISEIIDAISVFRHDRQRKTQDVDKKKNNVHYKLTKPRK